MSFLEALEARRPGLGKRSWSPAGRQKVGVSGSHEDPSGKEETLLPRAWRDGTTDVCSEKFCVLFITAKQRVPVMGMSRTSVRVVPRGPVRAVHVPPRGQDRGSGRARAAGTPRCWRSRPVTLSRDLSAQRSPLWKQALVFMEG